MATFRKRSNSWQARVQRQATQTIKVFLKVVLRLLHERASLTLTRFAA